MVAFYNMRYGKETHTVWNFIKRDIAAAVAVTVWVFHTLLLGAWCRWVAIYPVSNLLAVQSKAIILCHIVNKANRETLCYVIDFAFQRVDK